MSFGSDTLVIIKDSDGLPRAWGLSPSALAADVEAERQWHLYVQAKKDLGQIVERGRKVSRLVAKTEGEVE